MTKRTTNGYERKTTEGKSRANHPDYQKGPKVKLEPKPQPKSSAWWADPKCQASRVEFATKRNDRQAEMSAMRESRMVHDKTIDGTSI